MDSIGTLLAKKAKSLSSNWGSYTVLGSFLLYVLGYLALRFHLTALGISTDLSVIDERYLFTGTRFILYLISLIPSLLLLVLILIAPFYLLYSILPQFFKHNLNHFFCKQWQNFRTWWLISNRLAIAGIIFSLLMIQLVMKQCFLLSNLLLAENLNSFPVWLHQLLISENDMLMVLYFSGLITSVYIAAKIFYSLLNISNTPSLLTSLLGFLLTLQLFLIPVNYGILVIDKSMPRVSEINKQGIIEENQQAWLVWEGSEGKTFLLRTLQAGVYKKSLMTLTKKEIKKIEISGYDQIFVSLFAGSSAK